MGLFASKEKRARKEEEKAREAEELKNGSAAASAHRCLQKLSVASFQRKERCCNGLW